MSQVLPRRVLVAVAILTLLGAALALAVATRPQTAQAQAGPAHDTEVFSNIVLATNSIGEIHLGPGTGSVDVLGAGWVTASAQHVDGARPGADGDRLPDHRDDPAGLPPQRDRSCQQAGPVHLYGRLRRGGLADRGDRGHPPPQPSAHPLRGSIGTGGVTPPGGPASYSSRALEVRASAWPREGACRGRW